MSTYVMLTAGGLVRYRYNPDTEGYDGTPVPESDMNLIHLLRERCEIAPDFKLGDLYRWVDECPVLKAFIKEYTWCAPIDAYHQSAKDPEAPDTVMTHFEISRTGEIFEGKLDVGDDFCGVGEPTEGYTRYSISGARMAPYIHLPIILNKQMEIHSLDKEVPPASSLLLSATTEFILLDVLD